MQVHSTLGSKYMDRSIEGLYATVVKASNLSISYQIQKAKWYVVSGSFKNNGHLFYYKTIKGNRFISGLRIEYPKTQVKIIEPFIAKIAGSFTSE